ncbi:hypothetical protein ACJX0J_023987, partial [Zea mays]
IEDDQGHVLSRMMEILKFLIQWLAKYLLCFICHEICYMGTVMRLRESTIREFWDAQFLHFIHRDGHLLLLASTSCLESQLKKIVVLFVFSVGILLIGLQSGVFRKKFVHVIFVA